VPNRRRGEGHVHEGEDKGPRALLDSPFGGHQASGEDDDGDDTQSRNHEREPEAFEDLGDFHPEIRTLDLLLGRTPGDIVREEVGKNGLGNVNGQAAEEDEAGVSCQYQVSGSESSWDAQEGDPSKVFEESVQKATVPEAVFQEGERNVTGGGEHNHASEPDFETVEIPPIDINSESEQEVVEQGKGCTGSDTVC